MKFLSAIAAACALSLSAVAQTAGAYTLGGLNGGTNVVAVSATNTPNSTLGCSDFSNVGIQLTAAGTGAATSIVTFRFAHSLDSSNYETTPSSVFTLTLNGTTPVTTVGTISIPNTASLKLTSIENTNASVVVTNVAVVYRVKAGKVLLSR